jgi:hypothetical protein
MQKTQRVRSVKIIDRQTERKFPYRKIRVTTIYDLTSVMNHTIHVSVNDTAFFRKRTVITMLAVAPVLLLPTILNAPMSIAIIVVVSMILTLGLVLLIGWSTSRAKSVYRQMKEQVKRDRDYTGLGFPFEVIPIERWDCWVRQLGLSKH